MKKERELKIQSYLGGFVLLAMLLLPLIGCVEPFESSFNITKEIFVVEGQVTDVAGDSYVRLQRAIPSGGRSSFFRAVSGADVKVIALGSEEFNFEESEEKGYYLPPADFFTRNNLDYKLEFTSQEGIRYESKPQRMRSVPKIDSIYHITDPEGFKVGNTGYPTSSIFIDTKDPKGLGNYYLWTWKNFEYQNVCVTCFGGKWYEGPTAEGTCREDDLLKSLGVFYDYPCTQQCWDIKESNTINAQGDALSDGLTIRARKIAEIPYYNNIGGLLQISQQSVSEEAYDYLKLLIDQGQNTGGLADTPPAALTGNVINTQDPSEAIGGYFLVTSSIKVNYWIDRSDAKLNNLRPLGTLGGRIYNPEPIDLTVEPTRPPLSPCLNSSSRTNEVPTEFKIELF